MLVWLLEHSYLLDAAADVYETKTLGIYSTRDKAEAAVTRYRQLEGFCNHPEDFYIDGYEVDEDNWTEGFFTPEG
ncbi:MAG: hypothetical protein IJ825_05760 [Oscillospiraceae bacterium]|nr:hypothetical protein [Oscillospiraceae bacterium]